MFWVLNIKEPQDELGQLLDVRTCIARRFFVATVGPQCLGKFKPNERAMAVGNSLPLTISALICTRQDIEVISLTEGPSNAFCPITVWRYCSPGRKPTLPIEAIKIKSSPNQKVLYSVGLFSFVNN